MSIGIGARGSDTSGVYRRLQPLRGCAGGPPLRPVDPGSQHVPRPDRPVGRRWRHPHVPTMGRHDERGGTRSARHGRRSRRARAVAGRQRRHRPLPHRLHGDAPRRSGGRAREPPGGARELEHMVSDSGAAAVVAGRRPDRPGPGPAASAHRAPDSSSVRGPTDRPSDWDEHTGGGGPFAFQTEVGGRHRRHPLHLGNDRAAEGRGRHPTAAWPPPSSAAPSTGIHLSAPLHPVATFLGTHGTQTLCLRLAVTNLLLPTFDARRFAALIDRAPTGLDRHGPGPRPAADRVGDARGHRHLLCPDAHLRQRPHAPSRRAGACRPLSPGPP